MIEIKPFLYIKLICFYFRAINVLEYSFMLNVGLERKHAQNTGNMGNRTSAFAPETITRNIRKMSRAEIPLAENMPTLFTKSMTERHQDMTAS